MRPFRLRPLHFLVLSALALPVLAQVPGLDKQPPLVLTPAWVDFGRRPENQIATATVELKNPSPSPIAISQIESDCGCTSGYFETPNSLSATVPPGGSIALTVRLETGGAEGSLRHRLFLLTDSGRAMVPVMANIYHYPNWSIRPPRLVFTPSVHGTEAVYNVELEYFGQGQPPVRSISTTSRWFTASPPTFRGSQVFFSVRKLPDAPAGSLFDDIHVATADPKSPLLEIPLFAYVTTQ